MPSPNEEKQKRHAKKVLFKNAIEQFKTCETIERQALRRLYPELANVFNQLERGNHASNLD